MSRDGNIGLGVDWTFANLDGLINNRGETVIHEVGMRCPCNLEDTHAGQTERTHVLRKRKITGCDQCGGIGYMYRDARRLVALITNISEDYIRHEQGWAEPGDCLMSPKVDIKIGGGDRVTFTWGQPVPEGQTIVRGAANSGDNTARKTNLTEDEDRIWYHAESAIWCEDDNVDPATGQGRRYRAGSDFVLDGSKIIRWIGNKPTKHQRYTLKYNAFLEWIAFVPPNIRRDRDRSLGERVLLRKLHAAIINDNPIASVLDRLPFCDRIRTCS